MNIKIAILEDNNVQAEQLIKIINNWGNNKLHAISITHYKTSSDILNDENAINCNLLFSDIELEKNLRKTDTIEPCDQNGIEICIQLRKIGRASCRERV